MDNRDDRTTEEIQAHMARASSAFNTSSPFMMDEYACLICNVYFRNRIFESDLQVIEDLIGFFIAAASRDNEMTLRKILHTTNNLTKDIHDLHLENNFYQVISDDLKVKLRNTLETKLSKDAFLHNMPGEQSRDFYAKYARDLDGNWMRNAYRFNALKLNKPSRILDLGCGFGIFSHIASFNGHIVDSLDIPNASPILKAATKILKVNKYECTIKRNIPLLKFKNKFDHVVAHQIVFNGHASKELWGVDEWKFFLQDLHDNVLNDDGIVNLVFNGEHEYGKPIMIDGKQIFLGKESLEEFFKPFFSGGQTSDLKMSRHSNKQTAILTKKNIEQACKTNIFLKRKYSLKSVQSKYGP